jgi:hypothetical protein
MHKYFLLNFNYVKISESSIYCDIYNYIYKAAKKAPLVKKV